MAETKSKKPKAEAKANPNSPKPARQEHAERPEAKESSERESKQSPVYLAVGIIAVLAIIVAAVFYFLVPGVAGVPFATFKSNFQAAPRVALAITYLNESQYVAEVPCYTTMLEIIARTRNASTIDFLLLNQTKCEYSPTGLGSAASFTTANASSCIQIANNEPSIFMNYSATNYTKVAQDHLYIGADFNYLASCPIAAEFG